MPLDHTLKIAGLIFPSAPKVALPEFAFLSNFGVTEAILIFYFQSLLGDRFSSRVHKTPLEDSRLGNTVVHLALTRPPGLRHPSHEKAGK